MLEDALLLGGGAGETARGAVLGIFGALWLLMNENLKQPVTGLL